MKSYSLDQLVKFLESKGLQPEYTRRGIKFRHPQKLSRSVIIREKEDALLLSFFHALPDFSKNWNLSPEGELPNIGNGTHVQEALEDFFRVTEITPPSEAPPFLNRLQEVIGTIRRYAKKHQRNNYALGYEDLVSIGTSKTYELWLRFGDKPPREFHALVSSAIQNQFSDLLTKHLVVKRRSHNAIPLTTELEDTLPESIHETLDQEQWSEYLNTLSLQERALIDSIIHPSDSLCRDNYLNQLRYNRVKSQFPKARIPMPRYHLNKISLTTALPEPELKTALDHLSKLTPTHAWEELIHGN